MQSGSNQGDHFRFAEESIKTKGVIPACNQVAIREITSETNSKGSVS